MKRPTVILPLLFIILLSSCFGVDADITINPDGSGTIALEYRVSQALDALGRQDGNERWNTIPVGRADFQRTLDRLPDMRLVSFSSRQDARDIIISARMEFSSMQGLLAFLDAGGRRSSFSWGSSPDASSLVLTLSDGAAVTNPDLAELIAAISEGYAVRMSMTVPSPFTGGLAVSDNHGRPLAAIPGSEIQSEGRRVSFSLPLYEVLTSADGMRVEFSW